MPEILRYDEFWFEFQYLWFNVKVKFKNVCEFVSNLFEVSWSELFFKRIIIILETKMMKTIVFSFISKIISHIKHAEQKINVLIMCMLILSQNSSVSTFTWQLQLSRSIQKHSLGDLLYWSMFIRDILRSKPNSFPHHHWERIHTHKRSSATFTAIWPNGGRRGLFIAI